MKWPHLSLRTKLTLSFSLVIVVGVFLSTIIGMRLIGTTIVRQAQDKVRLDLNSAREVYHEESNAIKTKIRLTAIRFFVKDALSSKNLIRLSTELEKIRVDESLDILVLTDANGKVLVRAHNPKVYGDRPADELLDWVLLNKESVVANQIVSAQELEKEGAALVERARIKLIPTPKSIPRGEVEEESGMMIKAAAPVFDYGNNLIGVLYGGNLLNRNYEIVDKVKNIVYMGERYNGRDIGTATIFLGDARISTNVMRADGDRAIGTRVSREVYEQVIEKGIPWVGRAFVVNAWYITAYEPIRNIAGDIIGMLYVGMLEAPYVDLRNRVVFIFWGIAFLSVILLSVIAYFTTTKIAKPIKALALATERIAQGDLSYRVNITAQDEIGQLADSFNQMTSALQKVTDGYMTLTHKLEEKVIEKTEELRATQDYLIQSERLTSLGKLAAGIAHEINNPLTSILINSHLLLEKIEGNEILRNNLQLILEETTRCGSIVKGLLEFARQTPPEKNWENINDLIEKTLLLFESQILLYNVKIAKNLDSDLPQVMIDASKIRQVFTNIILNALEAMAHGGVLSINSKISEDKEFVEIEFKDTGCGITKENIQRIFDPFFTTKRTKGTGLGLSVSYGIVRQHDGHIDVDSEVGKGTSITVRLPINEKIKSKKEDKIG